MWKIVIEEWLRQERVHGGQQRITAYRPLIIEQYTHHPMARGRQKDGCRAEQHAPGAEDRIGRGRNGEDWAGAPNQRA